MRDDAGAECSTMKWPGCPLYLQLIEMDVTKQDSVDAAVKEVESRAGCLDILVNNAGVGNREAVLDIKGDEAEQRASILDHNCPPLLWSLNLSPCF